MTDTVMCARPGCGVEFVKKTHNQKYHDNDCCLDATNERLMVKYYQGRDRKAGKPRQCDYCESKLSRYNELTICNSCQTAERERQTQSVTNMLASANLIA